MSPKINNVGVGGSGHVQKAQNHEHEGFGPLKNEIGILLYQTEADVLKLFKVLFKYIFTIIGPRNATISLVTFLMIFLCSLCPPRMWSDAGVGIKMLRGSPLLSANSC